MNEMTCSLRQGKTIRELAHGAEDYLTFEEGMRCQVLRTQSGDYIVQARDRHGEITRWAGVNRSISVRFTPAPQGRVRVTIEQGKQGNKTAALASGFFSSGAPRLPLYGACSASACLSAERQNSSGNGRKHMRAFFFPAETIYSK